MEEFSKYGVNSFYVSVNHKAKMIKAYFHDNEMGYNIDYGICLDVCTLNHFYQNNIHDNGGGIKGVLLEKCKPTLYLNFTEKRCRIQVQKKLSKNSEAKPVEAGENIVKVESEGEEILFLMNVAG